MVQPLHADVTSIFNELCANVPSWDLSQSSVFRFRLIEEVRREYGEDIATECDRHIDSALNLLDLSRPEAGAIAITVAVSKDEN